MTAPRAKDHAYIEDLRIAPTDGDDDEVDIGGLPAQENEVLPSMAKDGGAPAVPQSGDNDGGESSESPPPSVNPDHGGGGTPRTLMPVVSDSAVESRENDAQEESAGINPEKTDSGGVTGGDGEDSSPGAPDLPDVTEEAEGREADGRRARGEEGETSTNGAAPSPSPSRPSSSSSVSASFRAHSDTLNVSSPTRHVPNPPLRVLFLSSDTGGGHRASAESLAAQFLRLFPGTTYRLLDVVSECGVPPYNSLVGWYSHLSKNPAQWNLVYKVSNSRAFQAAADVHLRVLTERATRRKIAHAFVGEGASSPDVVISVHPLMCAVPAAACANLSHESGRHVPFFTVVTDLGSAHSMWFDRNVEKMFLASEQLRVTAMGRGGVEEEKIVMTGLPIRRDFAVQAEAMGQGGRDSDTGKIYRKRVRDGLGLFPGSQSEGSSLCPSSGGSKTHRVVLVMGGGEGCGALGPIVDALYVELVRRNVESTIVVVCGRNEALRQNLTERDWHGVMKRAAEDQRDGEENDSGEEGLGRRAEIARRLRRIMSTPGRMEREMLDAMEDEEKKNEEFPSGGESAAGAANDDEDESGEDAPARKRTYSWGLRQVLSPRDEARDLALPKGGGAQQATADSKGSNSHLSAEEEAMLESEEWMGYRVAAARRLRRARKALQSRSTLQNSQGTRKDGNRGEASRSAAEATDQEEEGIEVEKSESEMSETRESIQEEGVEVEAEQSADEEHKSVDEDADADADEEGSVATGEADSTTWSDAANVKQSETEIDAGGDADDEKENVTNEDDSSKMVAKTTPERKDDGVEVGAGSQDVTTEGGEASSPCNDNQVAGASSDINDNEAADEGGASHDSESESGADPSRKQTEFRLPASTAHVTVHPLGFVKQMAEYMVASDLLISKAGPGTIAEAASVGLPVLLTSFLPGQEEGNVDFVTERGFGAFVPDTDPRGVAREAASWLSDFDRLAKLGEKAREAGCPNAAEDIVRQIGRSAARWKELNEENAHAYAHARQVLRLGADMVEERKEQGNDGEGGKMVKRMGGDEGLSGEEKARTLREVIRLPKEAMETEPSVATDVSLTSFG